jgi:zeta-carotene desaturase
MHWIFAKSQLFGGPVEHLSVVASGADDLLRQENGDLIAAAHAQISRAVPSLSRSRVRRAVVVREPRATFSLAPGAPRRPAVHTALAGFFLAGDWTDTGLPGTIEGAVRSGFTAAAAATSP